MPAHRLSYTVAMTCISRAILARDQMFDRFPAQLRARAAGIDVTREFIPSGSNRLDCAFARSSVVPARAAVLICHGIGETVERWFPVQQLLALNGLASLVFDYSGYGRSGGTIDWEQCERDAEAAFLHLQQVAQGLRVSLLGYSLGSGIAAAIAEKLAPDRLVLCAAFTSFLEAAHCAGVPRALTGLVPPIWPTEETLRSCSLPLLVVHGERDGLFPVRMARQLAFAHGGASELVVVPNVGHNEPFRRPQLAYWGHILARLAPVEAQESVRSGIH